jgi:hypothetical protein
VARDTVSTSVANFELPDAIPTRFIETDDDSSTITIEDEDDGDDLESFSGIEDGDTVEVYSYTGELLDASVFDTDVGAQLSLGAAQPAQTPLVVRFIDSDFTFNLPNTDVEDVPSEATLVFVLGDEPFVTAVYLVDEDTLAIEWAVPNGPLNQVGGPATYQLFDADNTDLVATGDDVEVIDDGGQGSTTAYVLVDFDELICDEPPAGNSSAAADGTCLNDTSYFLRVAPGSVQNSDTTGNEGIVFPRTEIPNNAYVADLDELGPNIIFGFPQDEAFSFATSDTSPLVEGLTEVAVRDRNIDNPLTPAPNDGMTYRVTETGGDPNDPLDDCDSGTFGVGPENVDVGDPLFDGAEWSVLLDLTGCAEGEHTVTFTAVDTEGATDVATGLLILDTVDPVVSNVQHIGPDGVVGGDGDDAEIVIDGTNTFITFDVVDANCPPPSAPGDTRCTAVVSVNGVPATVIATDAAGPNLNGVENGANRLQITLGDYAFDQVDADIEVIVTDEADNVGVPVTGTNEIDIADDDDAPVLVSADNVGFGVVTLTFDQNVVSASDGNIAFETEPGQTLATDCSAAADAANVVTCTTTAPLPPGAYEVTFEAAGAVTDTDTLVDPGAAPEGVPSGDTGITFTV